jgi:hypothetical protein
MGNNEPRVIAQLHDLCHQTEKFQQLSQTLKYHHKRAQNYTVIFTISAKTMNSSNSRVCALPQPPMQ